MKEELVNNILKLHTTSGGVMRIQKNLALLDLDVVNYCRKIILNLKSEVYKKGKNFYVKLNNVIITINSYSYTIITAHIVIEMDVENGI